MNIPVIVFDAHKRKYIQVGTHRNDGDGVTVMDEHGKAIAEIFGDEYRAVKPHDYVPDGRAVRQYDRKSAVKTAAWNFQQGYLYNFPDPVSIEEDPEACVTPPDEFFPDADSKCWCVPGFFGDNERWSSDEHSEHPEELYELIEQTLSDNIDEWVKRIECPITRERAESAIKAPLDEDEGRMHPTEFYEFMMMEDYLDACYANGKDTSPAGQPALADASLMDDEMKEMLAAGVIKEMKSDFKPRDVIAADVH